jgi:fucose 4-O-acetylase-like acetyltransferase
MINRINWIDQAKGIGILLVVIGHMTIPLKLSILIFSFHMPLFFFISGYLFNEKKYASDFKTIVISKFSTLVWPFIIFTFLALLLRSIYDLKNIVDTFDYVRFLMGMDSINVPLWFLTALFSTEIIFSQIVRFSKHRLEVIVGLVSALAIVGFLNAYFWHVEIFYNIHIALIALSFFSAGWLVKRYGVLETIGNTKTLIIYFFISSTTLFYFSLNNSKLDMLESNYGNIMYVFLAAFAGIVSSILLAKLFQQLKYVKAIFSYLGKNSLIILATHTIYAPFILATIGHLPYRLDRILTIVFIFVSIEIINRYLPFMLKFNGFGVEKK